ncbi:MAG: hypothetical protein KAR19_03735 [Bacteroidales bacterium]|nr:hypothetical protein [Bacteroidales bacterium]
MAATDLFTTTGDLRAFLPDVSSAKPMPELEFAFRDPESKVKNLIGEATYNQIKEHYAGDTPEETLDKAVKYLQGALANLAGDIILVMTAGERNENKKTYRYQESLQRKVYLNNANAELGQLLTLLDSDTTTFSDWADTTLYTTRQKQIIKTHTEFGQYYYIDESAYFFTRLVFLMKEITADKITPVIGVFGDLDGGDAAIIDQVKKTLAYLTMAMALRRFDFMELPKTIRNNAEESIRTIRTGGMEAVAVRKVSDEIEAKGKTYLEVLERMMEKKKTGTLAEPDEINDEENRFYLQT